MENFRNKSIQLILADDDPDDRELFTETIKDIAPSASLHAFEDGRGLLAYLDKCDNPGPDIIFLDINMPYICGKECLKKIRTHSKFRDTPVIIFSTSTDENDIYETYKYGANLFITKPGSYMEQVDVFHRFFALYHQGKLMDRVMASFVLIPTVNIYPGASQAM